MPKKKKIEFVCVAQQFFRRKNLARQSGAGGRDERYVICARQASTVSGWQTLPSPTRLPSNPLTFCSPTIPSPHHPSPCLVFSETGADAGRGRVRRTQPGGDGNGGGAGGRGELGPQAVLGLCFNRVRCGEQISRTPATVICNFCLPKRSNCSGPSLVWQVEYVEDLEEDESDIEDTAEWGGSYWGAPGAGGPPGAGARGVDSDSEEAEEDDDGEPTCCCCCSWFPPPNSKFGLSIDGELGFLSDLLTPDKAGGGGAASHERHNTLT